MHEIEFQLEDFSFAAETTDFPVTGVEENAEEIIGCIINQLTNNCSLFKSFIVSIFHCFNRSLLCI